MSKVLFIGPQFMGIYKDIIAEFNRRGDEVDFIAERSLPEDPYNVRGIVGKGGEVDEAKFFSENECYWRQLIGEDGEFGKKYDILFVLDGQGLHPVVFEILRKRNPDLYSVNYLFDTTKGVYRFDKHFALFDKVATFDIEESKQYCVNLLPIYWVPVKGEKPVRYKFFGVGRYKPERARLFRKLQEISENTNNPAYLKLQGEHIKMFTLKYLFRTIFRKADGHITWKDYYSQMYMLDPLSVNDFREKLIESEIIIDTNAPHQDGLTARFMWALGLGKKILTTNEAAKLYDFYTPEQVFVIGDLDRFDESKDFSVFLSSVFEPNAAIAQKVVAYRIDNWLDILLTK